MARNGLAIDFAHEELHQHLRLVSSRERFASWQPRLAASPTPSVVVDQAPANLPAAWMLAASNATYAAVLLWQALQLTAIAAPGRCRALLQGSFAPKTRDFLAGASIVGWAWALTMTAIFIWR